MSAPLSGRGCSPENTGIEPPAAAFPGKGSAEPRATVSHEKRTPCNCCVSQRRYSEPGSFLTREKTTAAACRYARCRGALTDVVSRSASLFDRDMQKHRGRGRQEGVMNASILVVDDEPVVQDAVRWLLRAQGYDVDTVGNGEEALSRIAQQEFDVVVSDIKMPGLNGLDVLERSRAMKPNLSVILMTGYA